MFDLRFPTALQIVLSLAIAKENNLFCTSKKLAIGVGTTPSLIRKLFVPLNRDGIITSSLGNNGGVRLGRPADQITLRDIYRSVAEDKRLLVARSGVPRLCFISSNIEEFFRVLADEADDIVLTLLSRRTVAASIAEMRQHTSEN